MEDIQVWNSLVKQLQEVVGSFIEVRTVMTHASMRTYGIQGMVHQLMVLHCPTLAAHVWKNNALHLHIQPVQTTTQASRDEWYIANSQKKPCLQAERQTLRKNLTIMMYDC